MTPPPPPPPDGPEPSLRMPPRYGRRIALFMIPVLLTPVVLAVAVFPLLSEQGFDTIDEIRPENIATFQVQVQNRKEIDGGETIELYYADEADFAPLLVPLLEVPEAQGYAGARGPWLGDYRIVTKAGRRGTVKLYWTRLVRGGEPVLRFEIGGKHFEGGTAQAVIDAVRTAQPRGRKSSGRRPW